MPNKIKNCLFIGCCLGLISSVFALPVTIKQPITSQAVVRPSIGNLPTTSSLELTNPEAKVQTLTPTQPQPGMLSPATQAQSQQPYLIELQVNDYNDAERQQIFVKGLKLVLVKNSNNPKIADLPAIKAAFSNPTLYVQRFNYVNRNLVAGKQALFLQITFDPKAITQLLQRASKVVWVSNKPTTLVWLAKDVAGGKILDDENDVDGMVHILRKKAQESGISIMLPALDLQDINSVKSYHICSLNVEAIKKASRRYGASVILLGCIRPSMLGSIWTGRWLLLRDTKSNSFSFIGSNAEDVITQAMRGIAPNITGTVTPIVGETTKVGLRIANVNGLGQYNDVVRYLRTFSPVTQIDLINISAGEIELAVTALGGQQALVNALGEQNKIVPNTDIEVSPPGIDLEYTLVTLGNEKP